MNRGKRGSCSTEVAAGRDALVGSRRGRTSSSRTSGPVSCPGWGWISEACGDQRTLTTPRSRARTDRPYRAREVRSGWRRAPRVDAVTGGRRAAVKAGVPLTDLAAWSRSSAILAPCTIAAAPAAVSTSTVAPRGRPGAVGVGGRRVFAAAPRRSRWAGAPFLAPYQAIRCAGYSRLAPHGWLFAICGAARASRMDRHDGFASTSERVRNRVALVAGSSPWPAGNRRPTARGIRGPCIPAGRSTRIRGLRRSHSGRAGWWWNRASDARSIQSPRSPTRCPPPSDRRRRAPFSRATGEVLREAGFSEARFRLFGT